MSEIRKKTIDQYVKGKDKYLDVSVTTFANVIMGANLPGRGLKRKINPRLKKEWAQRKTQEDFSVKKQKHCQRVYQATKLLGECLLNR